MKAYRTLALFLLAAILTAPPCCRTADKQRLQQCIKMYVDTVQPLQQQLQQARDWGYAYKHITNTLPYLLRKPGNFSGPGLWSWMPLKKASIKIPTLI